MAVFTHTAELKDQVTPGAKTASESAKGLADTMKNGLSKSMFDASNAMKIGKDVIFAAADGIKNAFLSLASGDIKGALDGLTEGLAGAAQALDLLAPGAGQAAAAIIRLYGAIGGLVIRGAELAIEASQAKMEMISMFDALGGGAIKGEAVDDMLDGLRAKLGVTKDEMVPLVKQWMALGITSEEALERMTTAALSAKALMGGSQQAADAFAKLAKKIQIAGDTGQALKIPTKGLGSLAEMGLTVDDVAKQMGMSSEKLAKQLKDGSVNATAFGAALQDALIDKGAGPLEKLGLKASNLGAMLKEYIGDLFEDLGDSITPFLKEVKSLFSIFESKTTPSGQALKNGIEGFFKRVFEVATKVVPMVKHFLLDCIIFGLKAYIALAPIAKTLKQLWEENDGMGKLKALFDALKPILIAVGVAIAVVVAVAWGLWAVSAALVVGIAALAGTIMNFVMQAGAALYEWASGAISAASNFIQGLVQGITSGAGMVVDAVKNLAGSAVNAFTSALGIKSPSTVMFEKAGFAVEGVTGALEQGQSDVSGASKDLAAAAAGGMSPTGAGSSGAPAAAGGGSGVSVVVEAGAIVIQGGGKSEEQLTEEAVTVIFERVALAQGV